MTQNKICPACMAEYQPHIENCADCGAVLIWAEECGKPKEQGELVAETDADDSVKVMEGELDWMRELRAVLLDAGIPCMLHSDAGCKKGSCCNTLQLKVSKEDLERSQHAIEEYLMELNPDLRIAKEMFGKGKCPACGAPIKEDDRECHDCGLPLMISDEDEE